MLAWIVSLVLGVFSLGCWGAAEKDDWTGGSDGNSLRILGLAMIAITIATARYL